MSEYQGIQEMSFYGLQEWTPTFWLSRHLLGNLVQLEWRNVKLAYCNRKALHLKRALSHKKRAVDSHGLVNTASLHGQTAQTALLKTYRWMATLSLVSLWKNMWVVEWTVTKHVMTQACKDFCCSIKAELTEKMISAAGRDPLSASYKKWTNSIIISWVCCSHLCSS